MALGTNSTSSELRMPSEVSRMYSGIRPPEKNMVKMISRKKKLRPGRSFLDST